MKAVLGSVWKHVVARFLYPLINSFLSLDVGVVSGNHENFKSE